MVVCRKCHKEMIVKTNGVQVRFGLGDHCYAGDEFECPHCLNTVVVTNGQPWHDSKVLDQYENGEPPLKIDDETNIWMG